jgi:polyisoprenoid-binding protein YceI
MTITADAALSTSTGDYTIDPVHSYVGFAVRHAGLSLIRGSFTAFTGSGHFDGTNPAAISLELVIDAASIDTHSAERDGHLRSADFFAVDTYPSLRFASRSVELLGDGRFRVHGELTVRDITKPVVVDFEFTGAATDPFGFERIGFRGTTTVKRSDWGLAWNVPMAAGRFLVGDTAHLEFEVEALPKTT